MPQILSEYYPPEYESTAFNCPYCGAYAEQTWCPLSWDRHHVAQIKTRDMRVSLCSHCQEASLWLSGLSPACPPQMIYPATRTSPPANDDLDDNIKKIYNEAADIANQSPRAACALLRLAIQMLLKQLGEKGDSINNDIKSLVHRGKRSCAYQFDLRLSLRHGFSRNPEGFKSSVCMSDGNLYAERLTPRCTSGKGT